MAVILGSFPARCRQSNPRIAFRCRLGKLRLGLLVLSSLILLPSTVHAQGAAVPPAPLASGSDDGVVSIGGQVVMRLRSAAGGMNTEQRVDAIEDRLTKIVAVPDIQTSDVVVYISVGKPPVIYVLGSRLITVDAATVKSAGGGSARQLAVLWAKRLQQILPRVDIRLPNEPEPKVPANPPLLVTNSLTQVGGNFGNVLFRGKVVMRLQGISPGGFTAAERADMLHDRLNRLAYRLNISLPNAVSVAGGSGAKVQSAAKVGPVAGGSAKARPAAAQASQPGANAPATILMGGTPVYTVTAADAKADGGRTPMALAQSWAKNIRLALGQTATGALPAPATPPASAPTTPPSPPAASSAVVGPTPPPPPPLSAPPSNTPAGPSAPSSSPAVPSTPANPPPSSPPPPPL